MFRLNWLRRWKNIYPNGFVPDNDHKFSNLRQFEKHFFIPCFRNFQFSECNTSVFETQVYSFHSCKNKVLFSKSTRKSVTITELQIAPD